MAQSQGLSQGPFRKLPGAGLTRPSPIYFCISGRGLFPHPSLLRALPPQLITRSGVLETREQQAGHIPSAFTPFPPCPPAFLAGGAGGPSVLLLFLGAAQRQEPLCPRDAQDLLSTLGDIFTQ